MKIPEENPLLRTKSGGKGNVKMSGCDGVGCNHLAHDGLQWRSHVNLVRLINLGFP
jgi:hypothetical protein